jgi:hypothetical protein
MIYMMVRQFSWIGDTVIALWGDTTGSGVDGYGWDGTQGTQPRFTSILNNFAHEFGIWEKQSSFFFQAKSCQTLIMGNMCVRMCVCVCLCMYGCVCRCMCVHVCVSMYACLYECVYVWVWSVGVWMHVCIYVCVCVFMCVYVWVCVDACACVCV